MARAHQKIAAQQKNLEKRKADKGSQKDAQKAGLKITCPICMVSFFSFALLCILLLLLLYFRFSNRLWIWYENFKNLPTHNK